jgi:hypothetical protein
VKTIFSAILLAGACHICVAADVIAVPGARKTLPVAAFEVERIPFGSGTPANGVTVATETAHIVVDGLYHVPNYLPGFPTAATIWPRELPLECDTDPATGNPTCTGYRVLPAVGRGEYIFVRPYAKDVVPPPAPVVIDTPPPLAPVIAKKPLG